MNIILYTMKTLVFGIFQYSIVVGLLLILSYVLLNAFMGLRVFHTCPVSIRRVIISTMEFSEKWGVACIIFFILGRLVIQVALFLIGR
ncbi:MAG: hypothetical protein ACRCTQ_00605 [Brevinemataceae bacterium]